MCSKTRGFAGENVWRFSGIGEVVITPDADRSGPEAKSRQLFLGLAEHFPTADLAMTPEAPPLTSSISAHAFDRTSLAPQPQHTRKRACTFVLFLYSGIAVNVGN